MVPNLQHLQLNVHDTNMYKPVGGDDNKVKKCTDFWFCLFRFRGWVGQQKSEHCSDFEIRLKKWTLPYLNIMCEGQGHRSKSRSSGA